MRDVTVQWIVTFAKYVNHNRVQHIHCGAYEYRSSQWMR